MEYPGNAALADDIKERIVSTYRQTVETARKGNQKEALLGCDFILKLDPEFAPAQKLLDRLQDGPSPGPEKAKARPPGPPVSPPAEDLVAQLRSLVAGRRFEEAMRLAKQHTAAVSSHATLQVLAQEVQGRLEAEPYVKGFLDSASQALASGDPEEARKQLDKARALDREHPGLLELDTKLEAQTKPEAEGTVEESGSTFSLDLEEPVTNFTLEAEAAAADPLAAISDSPAAGDANGSETLEDPLAAFAVPVEEPAVTDEMDEDPFAALSASLGEEAEPVALDSSAEAEELDEDPFAAFSEAATELEPDGASSGDDRISDLLAEGQAAFDRRDHQGAIDAWSRIFLIDLDNEEASRRIEEARQLKAESERQVEEIYHEGLAAWKKESFDEAKKAFEKVVAIEPGHARAQEHLERIAAGETPSTAEVLEELSGSDDLPQAMDSGLLDEILVPPDPGDVPFRAEETSTELPMVTARGSWFNRKFVLIGLVVLLAVGAGGGYLFSNRDSFFPNSGSSASSPGPEASAPVTPLGRAQKLHEGGKTKLAMAQLKRLPENHPSYEEAQRLLAEWTAALAPSGEEAPTLDQELIDRRNDLVSEARLLESEGEFLRLKEVLAAVAEIAPLDSEEAALLTKAEENLAPLQSELRALSERDWDFALKSLWRKHTADPGNRDVVRLLVNCYYSMAVRDLQRGNQQAAVQNLDEALALAPDDYEAIRHRRFAETYIDRPADLLYRIYVKYLPYR